MSWENPPSGKKLGDSLRSLDWNNHVAQTEHLSGEVDRLDGAIQSNSEGTVAVGERVDELSGRHVAETERLSRLVEELQLGIVPIGSIIAWHKSLAGVPALPDGWVECNGQTLNDTNSPVNGQTIPNLNGEERFLGGGNSSGTIQDSANKSHLHGVTLDSQYPLGITNPPNSNHIGGAEAMINNVSIVYGKNAGHGSHYYVVTDAYGDTEARPKNMSVVWIMRVK